MFLQFFYTREIIIFNSIFPSINIIQFSDLFSHDMQAAHKKFFGHSAHVTNVKFTFDDRYLLSAGGDDSWYRNTCIHVHVFMYLHLYQRVCPLATKKNLSLFDVYTNLSNHLSLIKYISSWPMIPVCLSIKCVYCQNIHTYCVDFQLPILILEVIFCLF